MKYVFTIDISGIAYEAIHAICGYQGKNLKAGRFGKFLELESEKEELLYKIHNKVTSKISGIQDICSSIEFVFDNFSGMVLRKQFYPEYKGKRDDKERPFNQKEFKNCIVLYKQKLDANNITTFELSGVEADDIIEYRAKYLLKNGQNVCIMSADSDLKQVVSFENGVAIVMFDMNKDITYVHHKFLADRKEVGAFENIFSDEAEIAIPVWFENQVRINPQIELLRKLVAGDTSDNIPSPITYVKGSSNFGISKERAIKTITDDFDVKEGFTYDEIKGKLLYALNESIKTKKDPNVIVDKEEYKKAFETNMRLIKLDGSMLTVEDKKRINKIAEDSGNNYKILFENVIYQQENISWENYNK